MSRWEVFIVGVTFGFALGGIALSWAIVRAGSRGGRS